MMTISFGRDNVTVEEGIELLVQILFSFFIFITFTFLIHVFLHFLSFFLYSVEI